MTCANWPARDAPVIMSFTPSLEPNSAPPVENWMMPSDLASAKPLMAALIVSRGRAVDGREGVPALLGPLQHLGVSLRRGDGHGTSSNGCSGRTRTRRASSTPSVWQAVLPLRVVTCVSAPFSPLSPAPVALGPVNYLSLVQTTTDAVALPGILDPFNLIGWFGTWAFVGPLLVIFIESGVLFPVLPGDSLLVAGLIAAGQRLRRARPAGRRRELQHLVAHHHDPDAAILGGQVGYWIGWFIGVEMFKPDARFLKQRYLDEAHEFFEKNGPITIFLARFVPIVRTLAPIVAGRPR